MGRMIIQLPVQPRPCLRVKARIIQPKSGKKAFATFYDPAPNVSYKELLQGIFTEYMDGKAPLVGPLRMTVVYAFCRPKSNKDVEHTVKPDVDNLEKILMDSMNGLVFHDDRQVISVVKDKLYSLSEGYSYVIVEPWTGFQQSMMPHVQEAREAMEGLLCK